MPKITPRYQGALTGNPVKRNRPEPTIQQTIRLTVKQLDAAQEAADLAGLSLYRWMILAIDTMIGVHEGKWVIESPDGQLGLARTGTDDDDD
jgi:hypothetical protein